MNASRLPLALSLILAALAANAQVVGVAVDSKAILVDGQSAIAAKPAGDSAVFFKLDGGELLKFGEVKLPTSYLGPPESLAVSARGDLALVVSSSRVDAADPKAYANDDTLSVVDLSGKTPRLSQTLALGVRPSSVKFHPGGAMAVVASNPDNALVWLSIRDGKVAIADKQPLEAGRGPLTVSFPADGKHMLVAQADAQRVSLYALENERIKTPPIRDMVAGVTPFTVAYCGDSGLAVVGNFGIPDAGNGDIDTVSLIDTTGAKPRVIDTVAVGSAPEDVACSPDGRYAATTVQNMSNRPKDHPFYSPNSLVVLLKLENRRLRRVAEAPIGAWAEGLVFGEDSRTVLAQSIDDRALHVLRIDGDTLKPARAPIVFGNGAPVGIGIAGR